jgi:hypothetical protein
VDEAAGQHFTVVELTTALIRTATNAIRARVYGDRHVQRPAAFFTGSEIHRWIPTDDNRSRSAVRYNGSLLSQIVPNQPSGYLLALAVLKGAKRTSSIPPAICYLEVRCGHYLPLWWPITA